MRMKINYEKVIFLGGFGEEPPKKKEICSLQLLCPSYEVGLELSGKIFTEF